MRNARLLLGSIIAYLIFLSTAVAAPGDGEIEVRGTLRCVADGAKKPVGTLCLAVEPAGFPAGAGLVDEQGHFRVRVPLRLLDKKVFLRVYRGESELSVFRFQLDSKRLSNESSGATFFLGDHDLSDACADLECDLLTAMALRERLLGAEAVSEEQAAAAEAAAEAQVAAEAQAAAAAQAATKVATAPPPVKTEPAPAKPADVARSELVRNSLDAPSTSRIDLPQSPAESATAPVAAPGPASPVGVALGQPSSTRWNPIGGGFGARPMEPTDTMSSSLLGGSVVAAIASFVAYDSESNSRPLPDDPIVSTVEDEFALREEKTLNLEPGAWQAYARESSSPALGRAITSWSDPEETALWNPSALVFERRGGLTFSFGNPTEMRMSARMRVPSHVAERAAWMPRVVTLGFVQYREDRDVRLSLEQGPILKSGVTHEETLGLVGFGFALSSEIAAAVNVHTYLQRLDVVDGAHRTIRFYDDAGRTYRFTTRQPITHWERVDRSDVDLSLTWNVSPFHRIAVVGTNLGGTEGLRGDGSVVSLREAILGYSWRHERWRAGAEVTSSDDGTTVAGGVNWRFIPGLALDLAGGSRFSTIQGGLDVYIWKLESKCRFRYDDTEATAASVNFGVRI